MGVGVASACEVLLVGKVALLAAGLGCLVVLIPFVSIASCTRARSMRDPLWHVLRSRWPYVCVFSLRFAHSAEYLYQRETCMGLSVFDLCCPFVAYTCCWCCSHFMSLPVPPIESTTTPKSTSSHTARLTSHTWARILTPIPCKEPYQDDSEPSPSPCRQERLPASTGQA
jgi:hypothetical protein